MLNLDNLKLREEDGVKVVFLHDLVINGLAEKGFNARSKNLYNVRVGQPGEFIKTYTSDGTDIETNLIPITLGSDLKQPFILTLIDEFGNLKLKNGEKQEILCEYSDFDKHYSLTNKKGIFRSNQIMPFFQLPEDVLAILLENFEPKRFLLKRGTWVGGIVRGRNVFYVEWKTEEEFANCYEIIPNEEIIRLNLVKPN